MTTIGTAFLQSAIKRLVYYKDLGDKTLMQLTETDLYFAPNEESNSIAVIMQHIAGNMLSRWTDFLTTDGEKNWRNRDAEFEITTSTRAALMDYWEKGWKCCLTALQALQEEDLLKTIYIREEGLLAIDAINRQLAHYPYHVGQMIYIAKILKNKDWATLSIPKGQSSQFNQQMKGKP